MIGNTRYCGRSKKLYSTYRCPTKSHSCSNKEINREYLEEYTIALLEKHIFNTAAMKRIAKRIEKELGSQAIEAQNEKERLRKELAEVNTALGNIADAVGAGLLSDALINRLAELESQKTDIEELLRQDMSAKQEAVIDPQVILAQYNELQRTPASPAYKEFVQDFISDIEVGRYSVAITMRTGLGVCPALDMSVPVRRQEIYQQGERPA